MSVHAFVDESQRERIYLVATTIVDPGHLAGVRRELRALLLRGQRELHFKKESEARRKKIADEVAGMPIEAHVYSRLCPRRSESAAARRACLAQITSDLLARDARRLVLDSRESQDTEDRHTIQRVLGARPSQTHLVYEHHVSSSEPLLWLSDTIAWCYGARGAWRDRVAPVIARVIEV